MSRKLLFRRIGTAGFTFVLVPLIILFYRMGQLLLWPQEAHTVNGVFTFESAYSVFLRRWILWICHLCVSILRRYMMQPYAKRRLSEKT